MSRTCGRGKVLTITPSAVENAIVGVRPRPVKHLVALLGRLSLFRRGLCLKIHEFLGLFGQVAEFLGKAGLSTLALTWKTHCMGLHTPRPAQYSCLMRTTTARPTWARRSSCLPYSPDPLCRWRSQHLAQQTRRDLGGPLWS